MRYLNSYVEQQLVICILLTNTLPVHFLLCLKKMWYAVMLFIHSFLACTTRTVQCHQFPEWTILSHVSCFIQEEVIEFQVLLNSLRPCSLRASRYSPPVLQGSSWHLLHLAFTQCDQTERNAVLRQQPRGVVAWLSVYRYRCCWLTLTAGERTADVQSVQTGEVCVDDVPTDHPLLNVKTLEEEGQEAFNTLLSYQSSAHISR